MNTPVTFELLRDKLAALEAPSSRTDRRIYWASPRKLGLAKTFQGALELFVVGGKLRPRTHTVRRHLEHALWTVAESGDEFEANRIIFPPAPHFPAVAALIAVELLRAGISGERPRQDVLDDVEPIIELALRQGTLGDEHIVGLLGELLCLEVMLDAVQAHPQLRNSVLDMWHGHAVGQRDFRIGATAIEIKTTQFESSSHKISGLHQVEPNPEIEKRLLLLSVGLALSEHEGQTLPEVVQRILNRLVGPETKDGVATALQRRFCADVALYGSTNARGYHHATMSSWVTYQARFRASFTPRLYDLLDEDIRILRRCDLQGTHVSPDDIQFRLELDAVINRINPLPNWQRVIAGLIREEFQLDS